MEVSPRTRGEVDSQSHNARNDPEEQQGGVADQPGVRVIAHLLLQRMVRVEHELRRLELLRHRQGLAVLELVALVVGITSRGVGIDCYGLRRAAKNRGTTRQDRNPYS